MFPFWTHFSASPKQAPPFLALAQALPLRFHGAGFSTNVAAFLSTISLSRTFPRASVSSFYHHF